MIPSDPGSSGPEGHSARRGGQSALPGGAFPGPGGPAPGPPVPRPENGPSAAAAPRPGVFLDRDGTLNLDDGYTWRWEDFRWLPGAIEALRVLQDEGLFVAIVTNQAGVARGLYGERDIAALHERMGADLASRGLALPPLYYCPHHPDFTGPCGCRKPEPGMLVKAAREHSLDLSRSFMVGDKTSEVLAGLTAGGAAVLVRTGYGAGSGPPPGGALEAPDVLGAAKLIASLVKARGPAGPP
ncbi:MAG: HAD family hydrolase [Deltaproteobacteria bacterium]|jgi:D-glycero-D-manno-heptose 1,7-bisphosphate phosphatase|nr:HAD family hydrolase [Deltaproteobacteria bacterium]